jgi:tetratricopeptide (TPR) repeat protein
MATAIVVFPLYDRIFLASSWKEVWRRRWGFYLGFVPALGWVLYHVLTVPAEANAGFAFKRITPLVYLCSQPMVLLHYLRLAILPDKLCLDYGWKPVDSWWQFVPAGLLILGVLVTCLVAAFRYRSPLGFVGLAFFLILAPTSSFMPIADLAFEHRMYLPLACVITVLVFFAVHLANWVLQTPRGKVTAYATAITLIASILIVRTFVRNRLYAVPLALWSNVLAVNPDNVRGHINYGHHMAQNGHWDKAIYHHRRALELAPNDVGAHDNLGRILAYQGDRQGALEHFRRVQEIRPEWGSAYYHIGSLLLREGKFDEALVNLRKADEIKPDHAGCVWRMGAAYMGRGDFEKAVAYLEKVLSTDPKHVKALAALGETRSLQGKVEPAERLFERALHLSPDSADIHTRCGEHFVRQNEYKLADTFFRTALDCTPYSHPATPLLAVFKKRADDRSRH